MEMREGLDLGYNVNTMLVAVLGNPWFTNRYIYWCLSALLLSWPLRVIIEYKTQYADYQVKIIFKLYIDLVLMVSISHPVVIIVSDKFFFKYKNRNQWKYI